MEPCRETGKEPRFPGPKFHSGQKGELRPGAVRNALNNMVLLVRLKQVLKHLSEKEEPVQMPSLHGSTHEVSVNGILKIG